MGLAIGQICPIFRFSPSNIVLLTFATKCCVSIVMTLAEYLTEKRLKPREFAQRIGVSAESIRLYLAGERHPRPRAMRAITEATDGAVTANDFFSPESAA